MQGENCGGFLDPARYTRLHFLIIKNNISKLCNVYALLSVFRQLQLKIMDQKQKFKRSGNGLRKFCLKTGTWVGDIEIYNWFV